jgi:hypothetical protein
MQDRICLVYGNDHSFRNNFQEVITSVDLIPELLFGQKSICKSYGCFEKAMTKINVNKRSSKMKRTMEGD